MSELTDNRFGQWLVQTLAREGRATVNRTGLLYFLVYTAVQLGL